MWKKLLAKWEERRRGIFKFWDGERYRRVDPADIQDRIDKHPTFQPDKHVPILDKQDEFGQKAFDITEAAICDVFQVQRYQDGKGLTQTERFSLLQDYILFVGSLKKSTSLRPILQAPLDSCPPASEESPMSVNTDSSSTPIESTTVEPSLSG